MPRTILHVDANSFYVSCEMSESPPLRGRAVVVGGDPEARHGIVLAKSDKAKAAGVKTGMALWQAKMLCPNLTIIQPNYRLYLRMSRELRNIMGDYSGHVEPFGLDEAWVGLGPEPIIEGKRIADEIRRRAWEELGITVSIGVADNKIMAKLWGRDEQRLFHPGMQRVEHRPGVMDYFGVTADYLLGQVVKKAPSDTDLVYQAYDTLKKSGCFAKQGAHYPELHLAAELYSYITDLEETERYLGSIGITANDAENIRQAIKDKHKAAIRGRIEGGNIDMLTFRFVPNRPRENGT